MERTLKNARRYAMLAAMLLTLAGILVVALTAGDYGVAWDDWVQTRYGELVLDYFLSGGRNRACNDYLDLRFYAPAFELPSAVVCRWFPDAVAQTRHVLCALVALSSIPALYLFGRLLGKPWVGVAAAVLLCLSPAFYGHAFVNTKDIPFAVGFLWSMVALAAMFARGRYGWPEVLVCGAVIGVTMSVRPGGWMLIVPLYGLTATYADWQARARGVATRERTLTKQLGLLLVAWLVMIAPWPWAHENVLLHPMQAIRMASKFHLVVPVLFEGRVIPSNDLPRYYLLKYVLITTPPAMLVLAAIGLVARSVQVARRLKQPRSLVYFVLAVWLVMPLALFAAMRPNAYDGMRHFLFVIPALAAWAAIGLVWLWQTFHQPLARGVLAAGFAVALAIQASTIVQLHPYQMTYFNCLAGGVGGAVGQYETDYWLTSYKEAIEWIETQPTTTNGEPIRVLVAANENSRWCAAYFAGQQTIIETTLTGNQSGDLPPDFDYYVGTSRLEMDANFPEARVVHRVGREGAVFAAIKGRREGGRESLAGSTRP